MWRRSLAVIDHQPASLGLQLGAVPHERLALPVDVAELFLFFTRHADHRQFFQVAVDVTAQPLAKRGRVARIGLYPGALLVELARRDDVALRACFPQGPAES